MAQSIKAEERTKLSSSLNSYRESLSDSLEAVHDEINKLALDNRKPDTYLPSLLSDKELVYRFGYTPNVFQKFIPIQLIADVCSANTDPYTLRGFMRSTFCRRAYFYLANFQCYVPSAENSNNLENLLDYFKTFKKCRVDDPVTVLENIKGFRYELAPLYETYVDSELFTALFHLKQLLGPSHESQSQRVIKLVKKIRDMLQQDLTHAFGLKKASHICDEGNLFWAICLLYSIKGSKFYIHQKRKCGSRVFEDAILTFLERGPEDRRIPTPSEIAFEVTPELYSKERTNLYIMNNLLDVLLLHWEQLGDDFKKEVHKYLKVIIRTYLHKANHPANLYFECLHYGTVCKYLEVYEREEKSSLPNPPASFLTEEKDTTERDKLISFSENQLRDWDLKAGMTEKDISLLKCLFEHDSIHWAHAYLWGEPRVSHHGKRLPSSLLANYCSHLKGKLKKMDYYLDLADMDNEGVVVWKNREKMCSPILINALKKVSHMKELSKDEQRSETVLKEAIEALSVFDFRDAFIVVAGIHASNPECITSLDPNLLQRTRDFMEKERERYRKCQTRLESKLVSSRILPSDDKALIQYSIGKNNIQKEIVDITAAEGLVASAKLPGTKFADSAAQKVYELLISLETCENITFSTFQKGIARLSTYLKDGPQLIASVKSIRRVISSQLPGICQSEASEKDDDNNALDYCYTAIIQARERLDHRDNITIQAINEDMMQCFKVAVSQAED